MGAISQWATVDGRSVLAQPVPVVQIFARITQSVREWIKAQADRGHG